MQPASCPGKRRRKSRLLEQLFRPRLCMRRSFPAPGVNSPQPSAGEQTVHGPTVSSRIASIQHD
ncbi:hypothetical protein AvCA_33720 [Azotobacter vinelandii CA]|uniref:Uncharacterized protein n=2 Tax=Azotobacter vinelandii TaxID=354 RepID=C1DPV1_AZOVD|nr:hypothetical protein Avin_33720 [Azotobacter vinelandii DJ]AGK14655.1 hypothetical protein AvCA_33720 [Azotobacter vinelandii CA]AGK21292.1 hypothetical protein AvCA6_33720 [Azotobacter vinelandii CA6]